MKRLVLWCLLLGISPALVYAEVKIVELQYRAGSELVEQVRELLDEGEKAQVAGNNLVLVADGDSLLAAEQLIAILDRKPLQLTVRMKKIEQGQVVGQGSDGAVALSNRGQLNSPASASLRLGTSSSQLEQSISVLEGGGGWLQVGSEVPFTKQWSAYTGLISGFSKQIEYKTISTGFWVRPVRVTGADVLVDIEPQINRVDGRSDQDPPTIRFSQLKTRLLVPLGEWYPLGSQFSRGDQVSREIISWRNDAGNPDQTIYLRIDPPAGFSP